MTTTAISKSNANGHTITTGGQSAVDSSWSGEATQVYTPHFDLWEGDEEFILYGDLPGVSPESLDIQFEDGRLSIHGRVSPATARQYDSIEFGIGDFLRRFTVGESVNAEAIEAEMKDGVVSIHLPKLDVAKPRRIEVKAL